MKVIGAGFGRTGTLSLKLALEQLGFNPCYHMQEVMMNNRDHVPLFTEAAQGKPVDWKAMFARYQATVDWPACTFYKQLMEVYPDAKVLLSVRDPAKWYESAANTIHRVSQDGFPRVMRLMFPALKSFIEMTNTLIWQGTFGGRFAERDHAIEVFNRHNEEVKRTVPPERLLVYDVKEGWEPLCRFLGVPVPSTPFPRVNDTATFNNRLTRRKRIMQSMLAAIVALLGWAVYWVVR